MQVSLSEPVLFEIMFIAILVLDGQSIATRLAKKICSSTTSLRRAISRFNGMPRDVFEGVVYVLPHTLQWETVCDMEELSMLEITSFANTSITKIPIDVWSKVIRASNMVKRATEEEDIIMKELINMNERLIKEHSLVLINIEETKLCAHSNYVQGCLNLLYRRLFLCEISLLRFSENVCSHHKAVIPNLIFLNSCMYKDLSVSNSDDQHLDLQLGPDSLSSDECDSDDSLVS